ncbi:MAG: fold metallo-hydrolase [Firmicutes bacterium]|nr:fold metallo-hydrolase [Bacillota bacterium]MBP2659245.1 fold metallo-hydrolase [Bacillota bacterium]
MKTLGCFKYSRLLIIFLAITFLLCIITLNTASCAEVEMKGGYHMMVGDFKIITLSDGINQRPVEQHLQLLQGNKEKMKDVLERFYPSGQIEGTVNAFLIDTGSKLVLIDTGNGKMVSPTIGKVIDNLRAAGYQPEQVDEIYLTHMHGDHVGGLVSGKERVFVNATVYANKHEANYWLDDSNQNAAPEATKRTFQAAKDTITPYITAGKFKTFEGNIQVTPGIRAQGLFGHTPGHTAYVIESKGDTLVLWGDIIHVAAVQFEDPLITIAYDSDKEEAAKVRQQILAEVVKNNWLIGGAHIVFPGIGHVQANDGEYNFVPLKFPASK